MEFGNKKFTKGKEELDLLHGLWMIITGNVALVEVILNITSHTSNLNISWSKHLGSSCFISESSVVGHKQPKKSTCYKEKTQK